MDNRNTANDRLNGEIHIFCLELEEQGHHNIDIYKTLLKTAYALIVDDDPLAAKRLFSGLNEAHENYLKAIDEIVESKRPPKA